MDNIGDWCEKNGISLTGHLMGEDTLYEQILSNGDVMRTYKNMQLPGIDLLCDDKDFNTAIQCRSVVRQYGREAMLSELYGVTGWDFDLRGHKYQGDWQACLGVTVRVPHLAWQSMKGEGKRDYPAPISYQSPWHEEYKYIEDHYARINTAMTRGVPQVNIAIVHPIDSYKTIYASLSETDAIRAELENNFKDTADWLLSEGFDFDYISESLLPDLCQRGTNPLTVGKMNYDVIILSDCMTLRPHTIKILEQFKKSGGRLIIKGRTPYMCLGKKSKDAKALTNGASVIYNSKADLISLIKDVRAVDVRNEKGERVDNMMFTMRIDGDCKWLFGAHMHKPQLSNFINEQNLSVKVKGTFRPVLYDTLSGEIKDLCYTADKDYTTFYITLYDLDTVLVKLIPTTPNDKCVLKKEKLIYKPLYVPCEVDYSLTEPNALLLDVAKYSADGSPLTGPEEIMRIDAAVRKTFNLQSRRTKVVQPWAVPNAPEDHNVKLVYTISSQTDCDGVMLALEHPHTTTITFNGANVPNTAVGYYVDRDIKTVKLPPLIKGENTLEISMPFGLRTDLESCYLIGNFGTEYHGSKTNIIPMQDKLCFGDVTRQGLAFYGGNIQYKTDIELEEDCDIQITISEYRGAMIKVLVDGNDVGRIAFPPFNLTVPNLKKGKHTVSFVLYGTRYNTFSALHNLFADKKRNYIGPDYWRTENEAWSYEYNTRPLGILKTPIIEVIKR